MTHQQKQRDGFKIAYGQQCQRDRQPTTLMAGSISSGTDKLVLPLQVRTLRKPIRAGLLQSRD